MSRCLKLILVHIIWLYMQIYDSIGTTKAFSHFKIFSFVLFQGKKIFLYLSELLAEIPVINPG